MTDKEMCLSSLRLDRIKTLGFAVQAKVAGKDCVAVLCPYSTCRSGQRVRVRINEVPTIARVRFYEVLAYPDNWEDITDHVAIHATPEELQRVEKDMQQETEDENKWADLIRKHAAKKYELTEGEVLDVGTVYDDDFGYFAFAIMQSDATHIMVPFNAVKHVDQSIAIYVTDADCRNAWDVTDSLQWYTENCVELDEITLNDFILEQVVYHLKMQDMAEARKERQDMAEARKEQEDAGV